MLLATAYSSKLHSTNSHKMMSVVEEIINIDWWLCLSFQVEFIFVRKRGAYKLIELVRLDLIAWACLAYCCHLTPQQIRKEFVRFPAPDHSQKPRKDQKS
jgi:hypothetical protein